MSETLKRLGTTRESATRLTRKAAEAESVLGLHGVSATAGSFDWSRFHGRPR